MRRSRIKVMATVPARRKPIQNVKEEPTDTLNATPIDIVKSEMPKATHIDIVKTELSKATPIDIVKTESSTATPIDIVERDTSIETPIEIGNEQADPNTPSCAEILEQPAVEIPKIKTSKNNIVVRLEQPTNDPPSPVTEPNCIDTRSKTPEPAECVIKESPQKSPSLQQEVVVLDNSQASGSDITKTTNVDASSVTKTSQTRTSFMRPTPRLDGGGRMRRNSVQGSGASASESEDDSRRGSSGISNRVRNDSVSSVHSPPKGRSQNYSIGSNTNAEETTVERDIVTGGEATKILFGSTAKRKRKIVVSESARKLAESRREFLLKHEHKQPDKSKLIMYDLIYYNPVTNPMKKSDGSGISSTQRTSSSVITAETEDDEDDEDEPAEAMPVPQVKVGPDGSLVIDEQSLVIEHTGAKKSRQAMARTEALVDEDGNGSGFYKKRQKSKDWPKWETLKFYKALNTVGTDFLLIKSLFPDRTRQDIKLKFKKEERINPRLVEKALAYHQEFDIDSLKEDLATFEESIKKRSELAKKENQTAARQRGTKRGTNKKSRRMAAASISEITDSTDVHEGSQERTTCENEELPEATLTVEQKKSGRRRTAPNDTPSKSESASSCNESGSDTEIYQVKPTRSGRTPKVRKLQAPTIYDDTFSDDEDDVENRMSSDSPTSDIVQNSVSLNSKNNENTAIQGPMCVDSTDCSWKSQTFQNDLSGISEVEPGSLVIVSRESADDPGETVLQVYMVSSDIDGNGLKQNMTPVALTPELLNTVTAGITKVAPIDIKPE